MDWRRYLAAVAVVAVVAVVAALMLRPMPSAAAQELEYPGGTFSDDNGSIHEAGIEAIAGHAEIENAIRDLKYGVGLNHLPSGRFPANAAWLAVQTMAHNLARWTARIGLGEQVVTTKTLRRRFFSLAGRLTRSARRLTLHLPQGWPWENQFSSALARLRALPLPS